VAVRTGGYQYSCVSSTYRGNIQLHLSNTYVDFEWENTDYTSVTVGISYSLNVFNVNLRDKRGSCRTVNVAICICVDMSKPRIWSVGTKFRASRRSRPKASKFSQPTVNRERFIALSSRTSICFFAVLGGSPGSFGMPTHVTLKVYCDQYYRRLCSMGQSGRKRGKCTTGNSSRKSRPRDSFPWHQSPRQGAEATFRVDKRLDFPNGQEFEKPYVKRLYMFNSETLETDNWRVGFVIELTKAKAIDSTDATSQLKFNILMAASHGPSKQRGP
jgi:hypothetical protein